MNECGTVLGDGARLFESLFQEHRSSMVAYALRHADPDQAEDVVQRAFEKVWMRRRVLVDLDSPKAYVVTAVRNEIHRSVRRVAVLRQHTEDAGAVALERRGGPVDVEVQVSVGMSVRAELARLSAREREAVVLRVLWQLSVDEAARIMGVSAGSVKGYTFQGLRKLRTALAAA